MSEMSTDCETIILDAMALMDGEQPASTSADIDAHVSTCGRCASEIEQLYSASAILARVYRAPVRADLWPTLAQRFAGPSAARTYVVIAAVFVCLILWRAFELAAVEPQALWSRLVALALGALLFMFLRANPFRLEPKLV